MGHHQVLGQFNLKEDKKDDIDTQAIFHVIITAKHNFVQNMI